MKHESVTIEEDERTDEEAEIEYKEWIKELYDYCRSVKRSKLTGKEKQQYDEVRIYLRDHRQFTYKIAGMQIDLFELADFLWGQYKPLSQEFKEKNPWHVKAFKKCPDCQHIWFISANRDMAWKFVPTEKTLLALSKPRQDFWDYPLENDLKFVKNKRVIRKILTDEKEDTVFFDILYGKVEQHARQEFDWDTEWPYDKFHPLSRDYDFLKSQKPRCRYCGKYFKMKRLTKDFFETMMVGNCCNRQKCLQKRFVENRRRKLLEQKKITESEKTKNPKLCKYCGNPLPVTARSHIVFCGVNCRVAYHRKKKGSD